MTLFLGPTNFQVPDSTFHYARLSSKSYFLQTVEEETKNTKKKLTSVIVKHFNGSILNATRGQELEKLRDVSTMYKQVSHKTRRYARTKCQLTTSRYSAHEPSADIKIGVRKNLSKLVKRCDPSSVCHRAKTNTSGVCYGITFYDHPIQTQQFTDCIL